MTDPRKELLEKETDKILQEVTMDCSALERTIVTRTLFVIISLVDAMNFGYPAKIWRLIYEVLYRYYAICEGLEKK